MEKEFPNGGIPYDINTEEDLDENNDERENTEENNDELNTCDTNSNIENNP